MEKFLLSLDSASKLLKTADHMTYITFPLVKEKRLLIKILDEIYTAMLNVINAILQYEYAYKRIVLYKDAKINFRTFREKCAPRFNINQDEIAKIMEIFRVIEKHKQSPMEFIRKDKLVILSDNLHTDTITLDKLKEYLIVAKNTLKKAENMIKSKR
jgi:hypothetical protein